MLEGMKHIFIPSMDVVNQHTTKQIRMIKMYPHSCAKEYTVNSGTVDHKILVTAIRIRNDINGNPRAKVQVWSYYSAKNMFSIWSPKVKGYRRSKDDTYILKSVSNLLEDVDNFVKVFEASLND